MRITNTRRLGRTAVELTVLGFGGSQVGNLHRPVSDEDAGQAVATAWDLGIRYFDTAPLYSWGLGEQRMGRALRGRPRDAYVLSTKVGRLVEAHGIEYDYSRDGVLRSIEDSLQRLGLVRIDVAFIHDIDPYNHGPQGQRRRFREAMEGAYPDPVSTTPAPRPVELRVLVKAAMARLLAGCAGGAAVQRGQYIISATPTRQKIAPTTSYRSGGR